MGVVQPNVIMLALILSLPFHLLATVIKAYVISLHLASSLTFHNLQSNQKPVDPTLTKSDLLKF